MSIEILVGFARVSTKGQDLTNQVDSLKRVGVNEKNILSFKHSGKSDSNKAALKALVERVQEIQEMTNHTAKVVVVSTKLDRIARSLTQLLNVMEELNSIGAQLKTLDGVIDSTKTDPFSKAMLSMAGVFAELERSLIVSRTQEGKAAAGDAGIGGRPKTAITIEAINKVKLANPEFTAKQIASVLGCSRTTIFKVMKG